MNLVIKIKAAYKEWKDSRFLKKHGCDNWGQYAHRYDTDVNYRSSRVPDYFMGYEYVHCITKQSHYAYTELYDHGPGGYRYGYHEMTDWCKANIKNKHRTDILRVIHTDYEGWCVNEIGGSDLLFFAFKDKKDATMFMLRWA